MTRHADLGHPKHWHSEAATAAAADQSDDRGAAAIRDSDSGQPIGGRGGAEPPQESLSWEPPPVVRHGIHENLPQGASGLSNSMLTMSISKAFAATVLQHTAAQGLSKD